MPGIFMNIFCVPSELIGAGHFHEDILCSINSAYLPADATGDVEKQVHEIARHWLLLVAEMVV